MNSKHKKTLTAIFDTPPPKGMPWDGIESLLVAFGATVTEGSGSRVKFDLNGRTCQIAIAREFLEDNGVKP